LEQRMQTFLTRVLNNPWIEWTPHPQTGHIGPTSKQAQFLMSTTEELLYGGAVRGGKTYALMIASVMYHDVPNHNTLILRKNSNDLFLPDGPYDISVEWGWTEKGAKWNGQQNKYTFPSGKTITFGYVGDEGSTRYKRYKSSWYQDIFFDQVEEIPFFQYDFLRSRLGRHKVSKDIYGNPVEVPLRFWSTANPDGYEWVYDRFVNPRTKVPGTRFIPATADDNPWIDLERLEDTLSKLSDPITYRQLRHGVWGLSSAGGIFDTSKLTLTPSLPAERLIGIRYWDLAATGEMEGGNPSYTVGIRMWRSLDTNHFYVDDVFRARITELQIENILRQTAETDRLFRIHRGHRWLGTYIEQEGGSSGKNIMDHYLRNILVGYAAYGDKVTGSKEDRARPYSAAVARGAVHLVTGEEGQATWIHDYLNELRAFPNAPHKDQVDASSGAFNILTRPHRTPKAR